MDYKADLDVLKKANAFDHKKQKAFSPDAVSYTHLTLPTSDLV